MKAIYALLLLAVVAACGPVTHTSYEIIQPKGKQAQACASQCLAEKTACEETCAIEESHCLARARRLQQQSELSYVTVRGANKTPVVVNQSRPMKYYHCTPNNCKTTCMQQHHSCHTGCGGEVIPHQTCTAFCD